MSLKAFHVVFVAASVILCLVFSIWAFGQYQASGFGIDLAWAVGGCTGALGLLGYGWYFLRKLQNISYL